MGMLRRSPLVLAVCLLVGVVAPIARAARSVNQNAVRARGADERATKVARSAATLGAPAGSQQLALDDGTTEYSVGVTDDAGHVGSQAVYLNRFTPDPAQLPITIDTVSILFPTSDQFGDTGLFPQQTFQALVYLDPDATGDPRNASLVERVTFDLEPSNTVFQNVALDEPVQVSAGTVYIGFTDPYVAVTHEPIYPAAVDTDTLSEASYAFHDLTPGDDFDGEDLSAAENGGTIIDGTFLIRGFYTTGGSVRVCWDPAAGDGAPPTNNRVCTPPPGGKCGECAANTPSVLRGEPTGYNVYRGSAPGVQPIPSNLFTSVPATMTSVGSGVAPGGSFFVVTATYPDGESAPSNEVGVKPATVSLLKIKGAKLTATGADFTAQVQVFVDGIPFVAPAKVKPGGTRVQQKGKLITGQSVKAYLASHGGTARVSFRNSTGALTTVDAPKR